VIWFLALSSLKLRPLRTALTTLGIAVAVGAMVIFLSLGEGLRHLYANELGRFGSDIQVSYGPLDTAAFTAVPELPLAFMDELQEVTARYGITQITPMLFHVRGGFSPGSSYLFQGLPPDRTFEDLFYNFRILEGRNLTEADARARIAVIGQLASDRSGLGLGDILRLNPSTSFEIVGISASDTGFVDNSILVPLEALQQALGIEDRVSILALNLREPARATQIAEELSAAYPALGFQTRGDVMGMVERGIQIGDVVRLGISAIALIVGAIAVANTMLMSVFERTREFGVIRAVGAKPRFLFGLVLTEAVILSVLGALLGILLGRLGIAVLNDAAVDVIGLEVALLTLRLALFAIGVALVMGLTSGLLPAARAARIPIAVAMSRE
jgi:putative ABC transport system permease protein